MRRGEAVEAGDALDIPGTPAHEYVRALIGAAPLLQI
jgi:ABC-type dipeptide/oligopeptide/nickel transport system ATPase component